MLHELLPPTSDDDLELVELDAYGAVSQDIVDGLGGLLGGLAGSAAGEVLQDPAVQATLSATAQQCGTQAQAGVAAWVEANRNEILAYTAATVGAILLGHFILSVTALSLAFPRQAFRD